MRVRMLAALGAALVVFLPTLAWAQIGDILLAPKTLIDRAIEARSAEDIAEDNKIVLKANKAMADLGTIKASTTIYEQRLLVTGLALLVPWSRRQIARAVAAHIQRDVQRGRVRVVRQVVDLGAAGPTTQPDPFGGPQPRGRVIEVKSRVINSEKADQPNPGGD